jgi:mTERF domain-containing protein
MQVIKESENESPLEPSKYPLENFVPRPSVPTFNFAAYVNQSESLKKLVDLGVNLSKIEKRKGLPQFLLKLDFEKDMKDHLLFLKDVGLPAELFGEFITKNPLIFKESIDDLHTRIYYLESKKFKVPEITRIVTKNPFWLMFSTKRIDRRLGFFQKNFELAGDEIRLMVVKEPRLATYSMEHIRMSTFSVKEEMGFNKDEVKELLLSKPKLWMLCKFLFDFSLMSRNHRIPFLFSPPCSYQQIRLRSPKHENSPRAADQSTRSFILSRAPFERAP